MLGFAFAILGMHRASSGRHDWAAYYRSANVALGYALPYQLSRLRNIAVAPAQLQRIV